MIAPSRTSLQQGRNASKNVHARKWRNTMGCKVIIPLAAVTFAGPLAVSPPADARMGGAGGFRGGGGGFHGGSMGGGFRGGMMGGGIRGGMMGGSIRGGMVGGGFRSAMVGGGFPSAGLRSGFVGSRGFALD